ncbi:MAG: PQQ-binding-like beta-propeller repeat protein [Phycisphaeraceae bacterium]
MRFIPTILLLITFAGPCFAEDWPQWRGPRRDGISAETLTFDRWPADGGPPIAWRGSFGKGHATIAVAGKLAFTMGWDGKQDTVYCFDAATGEVKWKQSYPCDTIVQWPGPRATPTIHDGKVFTLGQHGQLYAWDAATGRKLWHVQLSQKYKPDDDYGFAWSPLIVSDPKRREAGELLILSAGSKGLALHTKDGSFAWGNDEQRGACVSPVPFTINGKPGVAVMTTDRETSTVVGVDPFTGKVLWTLGPWNEKWGAVCMDPIIHDGRVFLTSAETYKQAARYTLENGKGKRDWITSKYSGYTGTSVLIDGHLYGIATQKRGSLKCLDWNTGEEKWTEGGFGEYGSLIAADGKLLCQTGTTGELVIAEATPKAYRELRRMKVFSGRADTFTSPTFAGGRIYCRSYEGEVVCIELK